MAQGGAPRGVIELRAVTKRYGRERVVDAVSTTIRAGEFFSLLGPSGSGKTTSLLMLAGFTLASGQWWAALVSVLFWWFYYPTAIEYEDRKLRRIFGERCEAWQRATPAVLPSRLLPQRGGQWSLRTSMSRNAEPLVVVYSVVWLAWIYWRL